ncbi:hypothetical protein [Sorangium sp. So ce394]|uniref:hypothetical protein n=1 Tax=Sorangium sp. So ce394 TaxID=3133310 RepID=UPI003F5B80DE
MDGNVNVNITAVNSNRQVCKYLDPAGSRGWRAPPQRRGKRGGRLAAIVAGPVDELEADQRIGGWRATRRDALRPHRQREIAPPRAGDGAAAAPV